MLNNSNFNFQLATSSYKSVFGRTVISTSKSSLKNFETTSNTLYSMSSWNFTYSTHLFVIFRSVCTVLSIHHDASPLFIDVPRLHIRHVVGLTRQRPWAQLQHRNLGRLVCPTPRPSHLQPEVHPGRNTFLNLELQYVPSLQPCTRPGKGYQEERNWNWSTRLQAAFQRTPQYPHTTINGCQENRVRVIQRIPLPWNVRQVRIAREVVPIQYKDQGRDVKVLPCAVRDRSPRKKAPEYNENCLEGRIYLSFYKILLTLDSLLDGWG